MEVHQRFAEPWKVTLVDTGEDTMTGGRLKRVGQYIKDEEAFCFTYGDGVGDVNIADLIAFHREQKVKATLTATLPPGRFGALDFDGHKVRSFKEKPKGVELEAMKVDTAHLGLLPEEAELRPYLASMGIYVFSRETLFDLLNTNPQATDFGKEIIPSSLARGDHLQSFLFDDYWEDIGTIGAFYEANLALTEQPNPAFSFYDEKFPIYTRPRYLPPSKLQDAQVTESIIGEGSLLKACSIHHCVLGVRTRVEDDVVLQDSLVMGADYFESSQERLVLRERGGTPIGVGQGTTVRRAILDKNVRIGRNVTIVNKDHIEEADRPELNFYIRNGIVVVVKNGTIADGTAI
jgi:glucose-1-phosphate adenylyltransferase